MIQTKVLRGIARARLEDSEALFDAHRYDGATYLCGYAIELALKARICKTLRWAGFPSTSSEFSNLKSFRTHSLDVLLSLTGLEQRVKTKFLVEWSAVAAWDPEARYKPIGSATSAKAKLMLESARIMLRVL